MLIYYLLLKKGFLIKTEKKKIIFLDRDGVINHDYGYVHEIEKFHFIDGVFEACKYFINLGYEIIIITNQSGIGRNYYSEDDFFKLTTYMLQKFKENGMNILNTYYCPHLPTDNCTCRKPNIGMIKKACSDFEIDLNKSWLIGDKMSDIQTAINANIKNHILISHENNKNSNNSFIANSLLDTINIIKG